MKKCYFVIFIVVFLFYGCSPRTTEPLNVQATIDVALQQTNDSITIETPTNVPTNTKQPTNTPEPVITPTLSSDEERLKYIQEVLPYIEDISDGLNDFSEMAYQMSEDVALMVDDSYKSGVYFLLDNIYEDLSKLVEITPPTSMVTMHEYLKQGLFEFALARSYFKSGLDNFDFENIESATTHMNLFSEYIVLATSEISH